MATGAGPVSTSGISAISRATWAASARPARGAVGAQEAGVHLLLREGGLPPAEEAHDLGPVGEGFQAQRRTIPAKGAGFHGAQFTGPGCCSITHQRPRPTPR